jgi:hypothetical protein
MCKLKPPHVKKQGNIQRYACQNMNAFFIGSIVVAVLIIVALVVVLSRERIAHKNALKELAILRPFSQMPKQPSPVLGAEALATNDEGEGHHQSESESESDDDDRSDDNDDRSDDDDDDRSNDDDDRSNDDADSVPPLEGEESESEPEPEPESAPAPEPTPPPPPPVPVVRPARKSRRQ